MDASTSATAGRIDLLAACRTGRARLGFAIGLVALGDWLLRGPSGSALLILAFGIALAVALANPWRTSPRTLLLAGASFVLGCLPMVEDADTLSLGFALAGLATFALLLTGQGTPDWLRRPLDILRLYLSGPRHVIVDGLSASRVVTHGQWGRHFSAASLAGWIVPIGLFGIFAFLFADANPLLARWLASADPALLLNRIEPGRVLLWTALLLFVWPFLRVRLAPQVWRVALQPILWPAPAPHRSQPAIPAPDGPRDPLARVVPAIPAAEPVPLLDVLLGRAAIGRALVLFNLLFAVQTAMDAAYLWGGVALPDGLTYAAYAHRGAYPLIVTALLAATFVLAAMRPGGAGEGSPLIRRLVLLFVAQNIGLVMSAILRLDLYVSVYSLTHWRLAAFVWMGLVAAGLVLIGLRIALRRSNRWLVGANLVVATATLWACCFVNVPAVIAEFNTSRQAESRLDLCYLVSLGPDAPPAIDRTLRERSYEGATTPRHSGMARRDWLIEQRRRLAGEHALRMRDWQAWTFRGWRLSRYLSKGEPPVPPGFPPDVEPAPSPR